MNTNQNNNRDASQTEKKEGDKQGRSGMDSKDPNSTHDKNFSPSKDTGTTENPRPQTQWNKNDKDSQETDPKTNDRKSQIV